MSATHATSTDEVERLLRQFMPIVSHDIRTPLAAIKGAAGLLTMGNVGALSNHQRKLVEICERNAEIASLLTQDVVDIVRLEAGIADVSLSDVDPITLAKDVWGSLRASTSLTVEIYSFTRRMLQSLFRFPQGQSTVTTAALSVERTDGGVELMLRCGPLQLDPGVIAGDIVRAPSQVPGRLNVSGLEIPRMYAAARCFSLRLNIGPTPDNGMQIALTWPNP
jgi:signal transduction histidine kinase